MSRWGRVNFQGGVHYVCNRLDRGDRALAKPPVTATGWVMRGVLRRHEDPEVAARLEELDGAPSRPARQED